MKKLKYFNLFVASGLAVMGSSCSKDFLEVDPYGKSDASAYYKTETEVSRGVVAAYDMLASDQLFGWSSPFFIKQLPGDDTNCGGGGSSDQSQYQKIDDFDWQTDNDAVKSLYRIDYYGVYRCNEVIVNAVGDTPLKKRLIAEAKFLRAYFFFDLTMVYGAVPLPLVPASTLSEGLARTPQAQVYAQIIKDLTEAIVDLPNKSVYTGGDRFRANKQAAQALLGKTYLYMGDNAKAVTAFATVIDAEAAGEVGLNPDFSAISKSSAEFGKERLFEASFAGEAKNWGNANWDRNADDNRHIQLQGPRGPFNGGTSGIKEGWGFNPPTKKLYNAFEAGDARRLGTVISTAELGSLYGGSFTDGWDCEGMIRTKYTTYASETTDANGATPELNFGVNWVLIGYNDVLLLAAEAYQKTGDNANALKYINQVRARVGLAAVATTGQATFDQIVHERQVELAYEGCRFWDLVRWGLADQELKSLGFVKGKHEHFPIPLDEMNGNTALKPADQNPGY